MELEDVNGLLNQQVKQFANNLPADLSQRLNNRATGITGRLVKSIRFEITATLFFMLVAAALPLVMPVLFIKIISGLSILYCLYFGLSLLKFQRQVADYGRVILPTQMAISTLTGLINRFTSLYFLRCILALPLMFILAFSFFLQEHPGFLAHPATLWNSSAFRLFCLGFTLLCGFTYFFAKWYIQQLYGRYAVELRRCLNELATA
jgi:hypothetical protein